MNADTKIMLCNKLNKILNGKYKKENLYIAIEMLDLDEQIILAYNLNVPINSNENSDLGLSNAEKLFLEKFYNIDLPTNKTFIK